MKRLIVRDVMAAILGVRNKKIFPPLGVNFHFYVNYASKLSFVLARTWRQCNQPIVVYCSLFCFASSLLIEAEVLS